MEVDEEEREVREGREDVMDEFVRLGRATATLDLGDAAPVVEAPARYRPAGVRLSRRPASWIGNGPGGTDDLPTRRWERAGDVAGQEHLGRGLVSVPRAQACGILSSSL